MKTALLMMSLWSLASHPLTEACTVLYRPHFEKLSASQQARVQAALEKMLITNGCVLTQVPNADFQIELGYYRDTITMHGTELFKSYSDSESYFYLLAHHQGLKLYLKKSGLMLNRGNDLMDRGTTFLENKLGKLSELIHQTLISSTSVSETEPLQK